MDRADTKRLLLGTFDGEETLLQACRAARERNLGIFDTYTPYAVHGLDEAMGLKRTRLTRVCFFAGLAGAALAIGFQVWASAVDWPVNIGGKSHSALPALVPITFEMMVLFAALGTVLAFFVRVRLWPGRQPDLPTAGITDDRFVLALEGGAAAREFLEDQGAGAIRETEVRG